MEQIAPEALFELYRDTLDKCGFFLLNENDDVIGYKIFEDFDIGIHSFFHPESLKILLNNGFISMEKMIKSLQLREKVIEIQNLGEWELTSVRKSIRWKEVMMLADKLKTIK